ncbi:MAG: hypothetical protein AAF682_04305 [Planctomycetota bacterium]
MSESKPKLHVSPFCTDVRSKKTYFLDAPAQSEDDILDGSGRVWCRRTMQSVGPDGELVDPADCQRGRSCFHGVTPEA